MHNHPDLWNVFVMVGIISTVVFAAAGLVITVILVVIGSENL